MSILIDKNTRVITQGITGKTGQYHTRMCRDYANGKACFVAGVNPKKAGEDFEGIPIYATVKDAAKNTGATVSVIYVPPAGAAARLPGNGALRTCARVKSARGAAAPAPGATASIPATSSAARQGGRRV